MALQQVALPLHEAEGRAKGFATLPGLLWTEDGSPVESFPRLNMNRAAFIDELCKHATPAEMVAPTSTPSPGLCCVGLAATVSLRVNQAPAHAARQQTL